MLYFDTATLTQTETQMLRIQLHNNIDVSKLKKLENYHVIKDQDNLDVNPHAIIVRSKDLRELLVNPSLLCISRAGSGTNNIDIPRMSNYGIVVFNTPGANAASVAELVFGSLLAKYRNILSAASKPYTVPTGSTLKEQVEKEKKAFVGNELRNKCIGVVGLGAIGTEVSRIALAFGMHVVAYDPFVKIEKALSLPQGIKLELELSNLMKACDIVTLHIPLSSDTRKIIDRKLLDTMKENSTLVNFSRGEIVDEDALVEYLHNRHISYITDFPSEKLPIDHSVISLPHLGASTHEAQAMCVDKAVHSTLDYIENGNIGGSVNFPNVRLDEKGPKLLVLHRNRPGVLSEVNRILAFEGINVEGQVNSSREELAATLIRTNCEVESRVVNKLSDTGNVLKVRYVLS